MKRRWTKVLEEFGLECRVRSTGVMVMSCPWCESGHNALKCWPSGEFRCHECEWDGDIEVFVEDLLQASEEEIRYFLAELPHPDHPDQLFLVGVS